MKICTLPLGPLNANCYVLIDETTGSAAIIDPGDFNERLKIAVESNDVKSVDYILLTHGHYDHIMGVKKTKDNFPQAKVAIHENDANCLLGDDLNRGFLHDFQLEPVEPDIILQDGMQLQLGNLKIDVIHTPGHTKGGVCFVCGNAIFSGDTVFYHTVGRTDFENGDYNELLLSIKKLLELKGDYTILPGHDRASTLEDERMNNPYLRECQ
ncbi:MAG: MBL fold metallo-hydrolase [Clostridiales bacterium]|nr:MBL fold metallo-hydrolase [Clostridiales bacterium]